ncbi:hypothetical protein K438DRAFT_1684638 [Mycena galopus ATCC 62051]|nr:hypothetical protein K438DRAFT_1684638 [Mycena galopus ATCC 62051]
MMAQSCSRALCSRLYQVSETAYRIRNHSSKCPSLSSFRRVACRKMSTLDPASGPTWDHVFKNIDETPPQIPHNGVGPRRPRRQTMTAQEIRAFNEIFNSIFDSMSEKANESGQRLPVSVSAGGTAMGDLFGTIRRHSKRMKWTAQSHEELDRKKDEMDRCNSDQQLLEWAMREVFGESQLYEKEFNKARAEKDEGAELPMIQPATYPHLIALLMKTFRDKYRDPHLALSMFDYARHLSVASYVFGCSTSAYNELIATRWNCFRDLKGVHDALDEMYVNGVDMDNKTKELAEKVRREAGERNLWMEDDQINTSGVWDMLNNVERLVNQKATSRKKKSEKKKIPWNDWRAEGDHVDPDWEFDKW